MSRNLVVIDSRVAGYEQLLAGLDLLDSDVLVLDARQDGVEQIADYLRNQGVTYCALHIVSHGAVGTLYLGSTILTQTNINSYRSPLGEIGQRLTDSRDILLYGCDVASGSDGQQFVEAFAGATGADVAASIDKTGPAQFGENNTLEIQTGVIDSISLSVNIFKESLAVNSSPNFILGGDGKTSINLGTGGGCWLQCCNTARWKNSRRGVR